MSESVDAITELKRLSAAESREVVDVLKTVCEAYTAGRMTPEEKRKLRAKAGRLLKRLGIEA